MPKDAWASSRWKVKQQQMRRDSFHESERLAIRKARKRQHQHHDLFTKINGATSHDELTEVARIIAERYRLRKIKTTIYKRLVECGQRRRLEITASQVK